MRVYGILRGRFRIFVPDDYRGFIQNLGQAKNEFLEPLPPLLQFFMKKLLLC